MIKYIATGVQVFRFRRAQDRDGAIIPPEAYMVIPKRVRVLFDFDHEQQVGWATVERKNNKLVADFSLWSEVSPPEHALEMMQKLTPAVALKIVDCHENILTHLELEYISVSANRNTDRAILPFGTAIHFAHGRKDLH